MKSIVLSFESVFDLFEFKKKANISNAEVKVNLLIGGCSPLKIDFPIENTKANLLHEVRVCELLNYKPFPRII